MDKLGIDVTLLVTQIINFVIIMFVLKKFAYKPVLDMLDKRKAKIEEGLKLRDEMSAKKDELEKERAKTLANARKEGQRMIKAAITEAKKKGQAIVAGEQRKVADERDQMLKEVDQERQKITSQARKQALQYAVLISEKLLGKKLDAAEQKRLIKEVVGELERSS